MEYFVVVFIYKMQQLEIGCVGNIIFFQKYYRQLKKKGSYIHIYTYKGTFRVNMYINIFAFLWSYVLGIKWDFNAATLAMDDLLGNSGIKIDKI